jgi:hypothetical protein
VRRSGDVAGIGPHGGMDGSNMRGPYVSGKGERRWFGGRQLRIESVFQGVR